MEISRIDLNAFKELLDFLQDDYEIVDLKIGGDILYIIFERLFDDDVPYIILAIKRHRFDIIYSYDIDASKIETIQLFLPNGTNEYELAIRMLYEIVKEDKRILLEKLRLLDEIESKLSEHIIKRFPRPEYFG